MRKLLPLVLLVACKSSSTGGTSTKEADALWALCPEAATSGFVVTPRGMQHLEATLVEVQRFLGDAPDLAVLSEYVNGAIKAQLGGPFTSLADVGLDRTKGLAMFDAGGGGVIVLPVGDREKLAALNIPVGTDPDKLGELTCKTIAGMYACSRSAEVLATIGTAKLPKQITTVGARGDIEVMLEAPIEAGLVLQLERGGFVARAAVVAPAAVAQKLVGASTPRVDVATTSAFVVSTVQALLETMPDGPVLEDLNLSDLLKTIDGAVTVTIAAGTTTPDVRVPLADPAPAQKVVDNCAKILPPELLAPDQQPGACRLRVETYGMDLDVWVQGKELRTGLKTGAAKPASVAMTPLGQELARGQWTLAFWGRGSMFGKHAIPGEAAGMPGETAMMLRVLSLLSELGVAARLDGDVAHAVIGVRTLWANPPDVANRLLAITAAQIAAGDASAADAIATSAPASPFAADHAAGQGGLMVPTAVIGAAVTIALPVFMRYLQGAP